MFLSKEELLLLIGIAAVVPSLLVGFVCFILYRHNRLYHEKEIEIRNAILVSQESERKRIANDLHDEVGSNLTGIKLLISFADNTNEQKMNENLERAKLEINKVTEQVRGIIHELYSKDIENYGIIDCLNAYIEKIKSPELKIIVDAKISDRAYSYYFQSNLYRICLELLNNSLKHSNANEIFILFQENEGAMLFHYSDNGTKDKQGSDPGLGLNSVKKRIQLIGGDEIFFSDSFFNGATYKISFSKTKGAVLNTHHKY
jgi:signal transduction histidine kinase